MFYILSTIVGIYKCIKFMDAPLNTEITLALISRFKLVITKI